MKIRRWLGFEMTCGLLLGILLSFWVVFPLVKFLKVSVAEAQSGAKAASVRIMDGAHTQLATVDHSGRLLVSTGSTSGLTDHITSVTHIAGRVMIQNVAGTAVTVTGTALDVNCTGCSAASVVAVTHISSALHIAGTAPGMRLHVEGVGSPGQSHGGVLSIQGVTGMNPVVGRLVGAPNVGLGALITHTGQLGVTCFTNAGVAETCGGTGGSGDAVNVFHQSTIRHVSSVVHVAAFHGAALPIQGVGIQGQSHGGVLTIQGITGMNAVTVVQSAGNWAISHISAAVHLAGNVTDQNNQALRVTGVTVFTVMGAIDHLAGSLHIAGSINGARLHIQGVGSPGQSHGGVLSIQGVTGMNAVSVAQSVANWTIAHVSSVTHVRGGVFLTSQAGAAITVTGTALDVNCTGCAAASVVAVTHISAAVHIGGTIEGARFHVQGLGTPGASHGGVLTIQGITGANAVAVSQSGQWGVSSAQSGSWTIQAAHQGGEWNIRHIGARLHVVLIPSSNANDVIAVHATQTGTWNVGHISAQMHMRLIPSSNLNDVFAVHITSRYDPNTKAIVSHAGALFVTCLTAAGVAETCGGTGGSGDAVNVFHQSTVRHVSSVQHVRLILSDNLNSVMAVHITSRYDPNTKAIVSHAGALFVTCVTAAGVAESCSGTGGSGDAVNVFHQSTIRHISSVVHARLIPSDNANDIIAMHLVGRYNRGLGALVTHGGGLYTVLSNAAGTLVTVTGTSLDVNCTGCSAASVVNVAHNSGSLHIAGTIKGAQFHMTGLGTPGQTHGGVFTVQGVTGMIALDVQQGAARWTVAHITSVAHVYGTVSLVSRAGVYANFTSTSVDVNVTNAVAVTQSGEWNVRHVSGVVHVSVVSSTHLTGAVHVSGISNIGSGAPGPFTTQMACHTTLAIHVAAAAPGLTQIIHLTSTNGNVDQTSWRIYICGIMVVSAHAQGFSLFEGTGTTCATLNRSLIGSYRPEDSVVLAASGGFSAIAPFPWMSTQVAGNNLCIGQTTRSTGGTISGVISYRAGP